MKQKLREISPVQLVLLLLISRLFLLMTFTPRTGETEGSVALAGILGGLLIALIAGVPVLLLYRRTGCWLLEAGERIGSGMSFAIGMAFGPFCIAQASMTMMRFGIFMISAVYPNAEPWMFIIGLAVAGTYAARLGLEPVARLGLPVVVATVLAFGLMCIGLWSYIRWEQVITPLYHGWGAVGRSSLLNAASYGEAVLFLLLIGRVKNAGGGKKIWCGWLAFSAVAMALFALLVLTALGDYAATRLFPVHTAAAAAHLGMFGRMDFLYLLLWVFTAFLRTAAYLYGGCVCLREFAPNLSLGTRTYWIGGSALALALAGLVWPPVRNWVGAAMQSGIWTGILLVIVPLVLLVISKPAKPGQKEVST